MTTALRRCSPGEQPRRWLWALVLVLLMAGSLLRQEYGKALLMVAAGLLLLIRWSFEWWRATRPAAAVTRQVREGGADTVAPVPRPRRRRRRGRHAAMRGVGESMARRW